MTENAEDAALDAYYAAMDGRDDAAMASPVAGMLGPTADEPEPDAPDAEWRAVGDPRLPPQLHRR